MIDVESPDFWPNLLETMLEGTWETIYMTAIAMASSTCSNTSSSR